MAASASPEGGGPCNMKKTIRTKGRYTDSQGCKETCSDGDLPGCCFPPHEVPRILKGVNKSRKKLKLSSWYCRLKRFGCINELIQDKIAMGTIVLKSTGSSMFSMPQSPVGVLDVDACLSQQSDDTVVGSPATCYHSSSASKRLRIGRWPISCRDVLQDGKERNAVEALFPRLQGVVQWCDDI